MFFYLSSQSSIKLSGTLRIFLYCFLNLTLFCSVRINATAIYMCVCLYPPVSAVCSTLDVTQYVPHSRLLDYRPTGLGRSLYP
jgi:hypothetical protein